MRKLYGKDETLTDTPQEEHVLADFKQRLERNQKRYSKIVNISIVLCILSFIGLTYNFIYRAGTYIGTHVFFIFVHYPLHIVFIASICAIVLFAACALDTYKKQKKILRAEMIDARSSPDYLRRKSEIRDLAKEWGISRGN